MDDIRGMVLLLPGLQLLIDLLRERGWMVVGPTVRDGVVVHAEIESVDQLPRGVGDLQDAGSYRLRQRGDDAMVRLRRRPAGVEVAAVPFARAALERTAGGRRDEHRAGGG